MTLDPFTDRLNRVRQRFVSTLEGKIADACAAVPRFPASLAAAATAVADTYRSMHGVVGIGPTVGFPATGRAARAAEDVLRAAQQAKRGLTDDEMLALQARLDALREAAARELQDFHSGLTTTQ
jgi:chemotaxis protein histidine kinase CheA